MVIKTMAKKTMPETNVDVIKKLKGVRAQLSQIIKAQKLRKLKLTVSISSQKLGNNRQQGYGCWDVYGINTPKDFIDAVKKIHKWIGYTIKVLEPKRKQ